MRWRLAALALLATFSASVQATDWDWTFAPYLWAASVTTDLREDVPPVPNESSFSDVVDKLDFAFQGHLEGQGDRFGAMLDVSYLALSDDRSFGSFDTESSVNVTMTEIAGVWNVDPARYEGLDLIVGLRHTVADADFDIRPQAAPLPDVRVGIDQSYTDVMVGARYTAQLSDRWSIVTRADGSWGDNDGAVNLSAMLGRRFASSTLLFGYRYLATDLSEAGTEVDLTMHGPIVAFAFGL